MANLDRIRVSWTGFPGSPGVSTFYSTDAPYTMGALYALYANMAAFLPIDVTISFPTTGDIIDPLNGSLTGTWAGPTEADVVGTGTGPYAAPTGIMIRWDTGSILDGHRLQGRTYLVPAVGGIFDGDGSIATGPLGTARGFVAAFLTADSGRLVVWHRPVKDRITHAVTRAGGYTAVNGGTVPDEAVILRSRRD